MLRLVLAFAFVSFGCCSDDQSFMQQGTAALSRSGVAASEIHGVVQRIGEGLAQVPSIGKMRQMAIDSLMSSVSEAQSVSPDMVNLLNQIIGILNNVLGTMRNNTAAEEAALQAIIARVGDVCYAQSKKDIVANHSTYAEEDKGTHRLCREALITDISTENSNCDTASNSANIYQNNFAGCPEVATECTNQKPPRSDEGLALNAEVYSTDCRDAWKEFIDSAASLTTTQKKNDITSEIDACTGGLAAIASKVTECNNDQISFENHWCIWYNANVSYCTTARQCYLGEASQYTVLVGDYLSNGDQRIKEAKVIVYVQCLIEKLKVNDTDETDACRTGIDAAHDYNPYNASIGAFPDEEGCPTPAQDGPKAHVPEDVAPGKEISAENQAWKTYAYGTLQFTTAFTKYTPTGVVCIGR